MIQDGWAGIHKEKGYEKEYRGKLVDWHRWDPGARQLRGKASPKGSAQGAQSRSGRAKLERLKEELELEILEMRVMGVEVHAGDEERLLDAIPGTKEAKGIGVAF